MGDMVFGMLQRGHRMMGTRISAAICAAAILCGCHHEKKITSKEPLAVRVETVQVRQTSGDKLRYSASIVPTAQVDLAFRSSGYVTNVLQVRGTDGRLRNIEAGDYAEKGVALAHIRREDVQNEVAQARAQLDKAVAQDTKVDLDFQRAQALYSTESLTKPEYDQYQEAFTSSRAAIDNATAALRQANLTLVDVDLKAPFPGYILNRKIDLGTLVSPSTTAFTFADISRVKVTFGIPDYVLPRVRLGQEIKVEPENGEAPFQGRVTSIATAADTKDRTFAVEVTVDNPHRRLKPGMIVSVNVVEPAHSYISIPLNAIVPSVSDPDAFAVMVVEPHNGTLIAKTRNIQVQSIYQDSAAVEGVQVGERVVSAGAQLLKDDEPVEVIP